MAFSFGDFCKTTAVFICITVTALVGQPAQPMT